MIIVGTPHAKGAGYFRNDDTASGGRRDEADVRTCTHCQSIIKMQIWKDDGGFCGRCMAPICGPCADRMTLHGCEPFVAQLERALEMQSKLGAFRKLAGLEPAAPQSTIIIGS